EVDPPGSPEPVELVDVRAPKEGLQRLVHTADGHALLDHLVPIDVGVDLGHRGTKYRVDGAHLGSLPRGGDELVQVAGQVLDVVAAAVLDPARVATRGAEPRDGRWWDGEGDRLVDLRRQGTVEPSDHRRLGVLLALPLVPGLETEEVEGVVGRRAVAQDR